MSTLPSDHPPVAFGRIGLLLVNLGTPDAPEVGPVRRYLAEFLSDRRVVELPPVLWQPLLRGFVLRTRPHTTAANYARIWGEGGSPLATITRAQSEAVAAAFPGLIVDWAMRYGQPGIPAALERMRDQGCERILIAPLYPQYSSATTGTVAQLVHETVAGWRWQPALRTLPPYHDAPEYIDALATSVEAAVSAMDFAPQLVLASFHGMPKRTLERGDPYHCQCQKTARLLGERLSLPLRISFQSRLGRAEWLKPYTDATLAGLPGEGVRRVAVVSPGFSADNLETLDEIDREGREIFEGAGGERFAYIPCLNATPVGVTMLKALLARELAGWVTPQ